LSHSEGVMLKPAVPVVERAPVVDLQGEHALLALAGIGLGLSSAGMQTASVEAVGVHEAGVAAGVYSTSRYLGSIIGSSVIAALLSDSRPESSGYNAVFAMIVAAAVVATVTSLGLHDRPQQP
jgi:sugar phosphate permease